ncbi:MAG: metalloregulator ArsR/SmtB family transcription factor [Syntrophorhabdales bacterium]|jgi:ArsR family transcriptional regulator
MENTSYAKWADILKTIGHPIRIKIIETLLEDGKCVSNIWNCLHLPQSTVSQHLSLLRVKGIVQHERFGSKVKYSISDRRIGEIIKLIKARELT